ASIAAALAWNEARVTRNDADKNAKDALKVQTDSLNEQKRQFDESVGSQKEAFAQQQTEANQSFQLQKKALCAQIQAMQLDERPFVILVPEQLSYVNNGINQGVRIDFNLVASGKTPALDITMDYRCISIDAPREHNDQPSRALHFLFNGSHHL